MLKHCFLISAVLVSVLSFGQANLFDSISWSVKGSRQSQVYGVGDINYLGRLNDTIPNALAISENYFDVFGSFGVVRSSLVLNRFAGDTARVYEFPGQTVLRGNFNGDSLPDFFCWDAGARKITILLGTEQIDSFKVGEVFTANPGEPQLGYLFDHVIIADLDSDGYDDALVMDEDSHSQRWLLFRGGTVLDSAPIQWPHQPEYGQQIRLGRVRNKTQWYVCESKIYGPEVRVYGKSDSVRVYLYPVGPRFTVDHPSDSIDCTIDTSRYRSLTNGFSTFDVDGDGVDDILLSGYDENYRPNFKVNLTVFVYKGGEGDSVRHPSYFFHRPFQTYSSAFGRRMIDVGNFANPDYHSLLVSDPEAFTNHGAIFLYNMGPGLRDSCVAFAQPQSPGGVNYFGYHLVALPSSDSTGLSGFVTNDDPDGEINGHHVSDLGAVYVFHGSASYGPRVGVNTEPSSPVRLTLAQNFPNPFSEHTFIFFSLPIASIEARLDVIDILGRTVENLYHGPADGVQHVAMFDGRRVPAGTYICKLQSGTDIHTRLMRVVK